MYPCPGNWVVIERAVVHYTWAKHAFNAEIKCQHCSYHVQKAIANESQGNGHLSTSCLLTFVSPNCNSVRELPDAR